MVPNPRAVVPVREDVDEGQRGRARAQNLEELAGQLCQRVKPSEPPHAALHALGEYTGTDHKQEHLAHAALTIL